MALTNDWFARAYLALGAGASAISAVPKLGIRLKKRQFSVGGQTLCLHAGMGSLPSA